MRINSRPQVNPTSNSTSSTVPAWSSSTSPGASVVDTQAANALIQAAQAVKLPRARVVLTGIGPSMAQTLMHLGTNLDDFTPMPPQSAVLQTLRG